MLGNIRYIDGEARGPTGPQVHELAPGRHSVRVEKAGHRPWEEAIVLASGAALTLRAHLEKVIDPETWTEPVTGMEFVRVPEGCFEMGSETDEEDERPVHRVCLKGFWLGRHEVTQGQWQRVMGDNPSRFRKGDDHPVEQVSWQDAEAFIAKLNVRGQGGFRLPSEAEWEYACRSGGRAETYCGGEVADRLAWYSLNSGWSTHPVGTKRANGLGLHDMSGNVWEWLKDCWNDSYRGAPQDGSAWVQGGCAGRVIRGGSWGDRPRDVRAANRFQDWPSDRIEGVGFRLARTH